MASSVLIAGPTGLIGSTTLQQALADTRFSRVIALTRRTLGIKDPKLTEWTSTGSDLLSALRPERVDAVICCLGTTIGKEGGDQQKFIHVDKDLVVGIGRAGIAQVGGLRP